jgi:hypothetical protein
MVVGARGYRAGNTEQEDCGMFDNDEVPDTGTVTIDCDDCAVRGPGCQDCVVSVLLGAPETLLDDERRALEVLADVGLAPRLRLVPIHGRNNSGVA